MICRTTSAKKHTPISHLVQKDLRTKTIVKIILLPVKFSLQLDRLG